MKKLLLASCLFTLTAAFAQDVHFSQMNYSPIQVNPALVGADHELQAIALYRSQWQSISYPFKTINASFDMRLNNRRNKKGYFAGGLQFFSDQAGEVKVSATNISLSFGYHVKIGEGQTLGGALLGAYHQNSINYDDARWGSQYNGLKWDGTLPSNEFVSNSSFGFFDAGVGVVYNYKKHDSYKIGGDQQWFSAGVAMYHLNRAKYGFIDLSNDKLYSRISIFARGLVGIGNSKFSAAPSVFYQMQGPARELLMGTYIRYQFQEGSKYTGLKDAIAFGPGIFYRNKDAVVFKFLLEWSNYALGFAYDLNTSSLQQASKGRGGFEVMLRFVYPSPFGGAMNKSRI